MEALGLDLKILIAQIVNFGILLFVLNRLLYKPVIKILDERKKKTEEALKNTQEIEKRLGFIEEEQKKILAEARQKGEEERTSLKKQGENEKGEIIQAAKEAARREAEKGISQIKEEETTARQRLKEELSEEIVDRITKKLSSSLTKEDQHRMIKRILTK